MADRWEGRGSGVHLFVWRSRIEDCFCYFLQNYLTYTTMNLQVQFESVPAVNFSMQQNHVPVIREIRIKNEEDRTDRALRADNFRSGIFEPFQMHLDALSPGEEKQWTVIPLRVSTSYLSNLTEQILGLYGLRFPRRTKFFFPLRMRSRCWHSISGNLDFAGNVGCIRYPEFSGDSSDHQAGRIRFIGIRTRIRNTTRCIVLSLPGKHWTSLRKK